MSLLRILSLVLLTPFAPRAQWTHRYPLVGITPHHIYVEFRPETRLR
jgi:hypothetical protein